MKHYLLIYSYGPDYLSRRGAFRSAHLALAWAAVEAEQLVLAGALTEPAETGMLLFSVGDVRGGRALRRKRSPRPQRIG